MDVGQLDVRAVDGVLFGDADRFGCGFFAVSPPRGCGGADGAGGAELFEGGVRELVSFRFRRRAVRAGHHGQLRAGFPLRVGNPGQVSQPTARFFGHLLCGNSSEVWRWLGAGRKVGQGCSTRMFVRYFFRDRVLRRQAYSGRREASTHRAFFVSHSSMKNFAASLSPANQLLSFLPCLTCTVFPFPPLCDVCVCVLSIVSLELGRTRLHTAVGCGIPNNARSTEWGTREVQNFDSGVTMSRAASMHRRKLCILSTVTAISCLAGVLVRNVLGTCTTVGSHSRCVAQDA